MNDAALSQARYKSVTIMHHKQYSREQRPCASRDIGMDPRKMARSEELEPLTPWFKALCSNFKFAINQHTCCNNMVHSEICANKNNIKTKTSTTAIWQKVLVLIL